MKSAILSFALIFFCGVSCFAQQDSSSSSIARLPHRYVTRPLKASPELSSHAAAALTIPTWTAATDGYTYEMVGHSPYTAQPAATATTTIATPIIPVVLTFSDKTVFDPTAPDAVCSAAGIPTTLMKSSPLFNASTFSIGGNATESDTYINFFQRANFWNYTNPTTGINPNYQIALTTSVGPSLSVTVPAASGKTTTSTAPSACGKLGEVDINWLDNYLTTTGFKTLASNGITPATLPLFMLYNVVMYDTSASTCCILGYHSAATSSNAIQTYAVAEFDTSDRFGTTADVAAFSHEIAEWMDDPLGNNPTPPWGNIGEVTGCQSDLEVGDPLAGTDIAITMSNNYKYHVQELAFLSWFYHQSPSIGLNGWYSSNGTFKSFANACSTTRTTLSISPTTIPAGGSATVNIAVRPTAATPAAAVAVPTGSVTLVADDTGKTLATYTLASGAVTNATLTPPSGTYPVTANYAGDGTYSPSVSAAVNLKVGTSAVSFSPLSVDFGNQTVQTASASHMVKLTNNGTAALGSIVISIAGASAGDYSQTNTCGTSLVAAGTCTISVTFKPTATGLRTAAISVADNGTGSPQTVPLTGTGVAAGTGTLTINPASLSFGSVNLGSSSPSQSVTLSNTGTASLRFFVSLVGADTGDFPTTDNCKQSLAAGATCTIAVTFKPEAAGARTASLNFVGGGGATAVVVQTVPLSGTGVSTGTPAVKLGETSLAFGSEPEGQQTASQSATITNSGTGALSIASITFTGTNPHDFTGSDNCPTLLAAGASCTVAVRFRPVETGSLTATLSIADNATGSPQTVALTGTGTVPVPSHGHSR